ncbi:unnamed protein product, partial [Prorocentrum cordatum]
MRWLGVLGTDVDHEHDHFQAAPIDRRLATNFWAPATGGDYCLGALPRAGRGAGGSTFLWGGAGPHPAPGIDLGGLRKKNFGATAFQTDDKAVLWSRSGPGARHK